MKIINLTPHAIVVMDKTYPASGLVARVDMESKVVGKLDGFPVIENIVTGNNLPNHIEGTILLVSAMVLGMAKELGRKDCVAPDTNNAIRNEKGHIVSVPGFVR